jgi:rod shape-determining protein MreD
MMPSSARRLPPRTFSPMRRTRAVRLKPLQVVVICLSALLLQTALPHYVPQAGVLDLPLMAVIYLALVRRSPLIGMGIGMIVGIAQDGLTAGPVGLFGSLKTAAGYAAGAIGAYIEIKFPGARSVLTALFFLAHTVLFWFVTGALLGGAVDADIPKTLILAVVHAGLALSLYKIFDRMSPVS